MKIECGIVRDLLPLYAEQITSEASNKAVEEHLKECEQCSKAYQEMKMPELQIQYDKTPAESFHKYIKKRKWRLGAIVAVITTVITTVIILCVVFIRLALIGASISFLALDSMSAPIYEDTDVSHYQQYMGDDARKEYVHKWGMDESIFPKEISDEINVTDYKMVYYNPWDAQYLSYLVVEYDDRSYKSELERLQKYDSTEYLGYFGAEGFSEEYPLLAMEASPDFGLIYALSGEENRIIYVELIFCNYFYDLDYKNMISEQYLPIGFDATTESAYRQQRLKNH
ncbi:MAG: zf-HC2 domain-containing protein [Acetatifactor sp.]|nr:zf-HC2 domain-containing protein [Acetatifactor sp.]